MRKMNCVSASNSSFENSNWFVETILIGHFYEGPEFYLEASTSRLRLPTLDIDTKFSR
jgi:hypothetical protein